MRKGRRRFSVSSPLLQELRTGTPPGYRFMHNLPNKPLTGHTICKILITKETICKIFKTQQLSFLWRSGRHKPEAGGFCLYFKLIIRGLSRGGTGNREQGTGSREQAAQQSSSAEMTNAVSDVKAGFRSADYLPAWGWGGFGAAWHQLCGWPQARVAVKSIGMGSSDWLSPGDSLGTESDGA